MVELLIVAALIVLNAFFAASEMALMTSRKLRLKQLANDSTRPSRGARAALTLAERPDKLLSTVQIGITLITILTGVLGGDALGTIIAEWLKPLMPFAGRHATTIGVGTAVTLITAASVIFGELIPKRLALTNPERIASTVAIPLLALSNAASPLVAMLGVINRGVLRLFGIRDGQRSKITEEEIQLLVSEGHEQGVIDLDERNMVTRVMRLGDRTADSLMTPRTRITWLDVAAPLEENLETLRESAFSRYPVYRGDDSDVAGILEVKTLLDELGRSQPALFNDIRPALFVSESTHVMKLLEILREEQQSLALVVDEYGDIQGLVTIADIVDAVIGRLQTSGDDDSDNALVVTREDGSLLVDGGLHVDELRELTGERFEDAHELDYRTAAGMVIAHVGRIPHVGEVIRIGAWRIEVVDLDGPRVDKLLLQRESPTPDVTNAADTAA